MYVYMYTVRKSPTENNTEKKKGVCMYVCMYVYMYTVRKSPTKNNTENKKGVCMYVYMYTVSKSPTENSTEIFQKKNTENHTENHTETNTENKKSEGFSVFLFIFFTIKNTENHTENHTENKKGPQTSGKSQTSTGKRSCMNMHVYYRTTCLLQDYMNTIYYPDVRKRPNFNRKTQLHEYACLLQDYMFTTHQ